MQLLEGAAANRKSSLGPPPKRNHNHKPSTKRGVFASTDQNSEHYLRNVASDLKLIKKSPYFKEETLHDRRISSIMGTIIETGGNYQGVSGSLDRLHHTKLVDVSSSQRKLEKTS